MEEPQKQMIEALATKIAESQAKSGGIANLAAAFVRAKKDIHNVVKNAQNPHFGSNYADLAAVLDTFTQSFADNDLALIQAPGELSDNNVTVVGLLIHKSGESIHFRTQVPLGTKATAQAAGACITYARRYQAAAIAGIAQVDDDGNAASDSTPRRGAAPKKTETDESYAQTVERFMSQIEKAATVAELEGGKAAIAELGDRVVADAYVARRKELKAAGKATA